MKLKQLFILLFILTLLVSCRTTDKIIVNKKLIDPEGETILIGQITREALKQSEFNSWYSDEYNSYIPDRNVINKIKNKIKHYRIEIYLGTWCSDTHEQLPRFLKILDEANYPQRKLKLYAVNRKKESFYGEQNQKNIIKIPTFILYKANNNPKRRDMEIGRIIESPNESLELDLYKILNFYRK
ncbi:Thioredoxin [Apibacter mensalis]|uniref:Thioredoxin n=1 Tax=Apibacter mensalis TaxID=1586267 RepID=A0A0X3AM60_9FLAO|nr:hypothetical protein [Apibacter mensalis]CVK15470.1 Thioredoxin [Apibacter mensalis]